MERVNRFAGTPVPSPFFGPMDRDTWVKLNCVHAAHHLRFLDTEVVNEPACRPYQRRRLAQPALQGVLTWLPPQQKTGKIVQVIGSTFDVEFDEGHLPEIYNALKIDADVQGRRRST